jgi:hypothetical protein
MSAFLYGALLAIAATPAPAQNASPPQSDDEIIVQGTRPTKRQVSDFVKALVKVPNFDQISRFQSPACPVAMGLSSVQNRQVVERMRRVADAARIPLAPQNCAPNIFVIVAPDKRAAIAELNRRYPAYFWGLSAKQVRRLASAPEPASAWQVATRVSADRELLKKAAGAGYYIVETGNSPSRLRAASVPSFVASVVVVDLGSAVGLSVIQLADYAALRTFADVDPDRVLKTGAPTVLGVLGAPADSPLPASLTYWDLGYLKALYSTNNAYYAGYQRGDIEQMVRKELNRSGRSPRR